MDLATLLAAVQNRQPVAHGIGLASSYLETILPYRGAGPASDAAYGRALKDAQRKLCYRNEEMIATGGLSRATGVWASFGVPERKDADQPTVKSCMELECILTSAKMDRDGDVLEPKGAILDMAMPLLLQHDPCQPIGKLMGVVSRNDDFIKTHFAIADTKLGRDAAVLVEFGALRISHGFAPLEFEPLEESKDGRTPGFRVPKYEVMEGSLVSIPSNTDAVITAWARSKLHHPLVKGYAEDLFRKRTPMANGATLPGGAIINVFVNGGPMATATDEQKAREAEQALTKGKAVDKTHIAKDDDEGKEDEAKDDEEAKADEEEPDMPAGPMTVEQIRDGLLAMAANGDLPPEVQAQLQAMAIGASELVGALGGAQGKYDEALGKQDDALDKDDEDKLDDALHGLGKDDEEAKDDEEKDDDDKDDELDEDSKEDELGLVDTDEEEDEEDEEDEEEDKEADLLDDMDDVNGDEDKEDDEKSIAEAAQRGFHVATRAAAWSVISNLTDGKRLHKNTLTALQSAVKGAIRREERIAFHKFLRS